MMDENESEGVIITHQRAARAGSSDDSSTTTTASDDTCTSNDESRRRRHETEEGPTEVRTCQGCEQTCDLVELWHGGMSKEDFHAYFSDFSKSLLYDYCVKCHRAKEESDRKQEQLRLDTEARLYGYLCPEFSRYRTVTTEDDDDDDDDNDENDAWTHCPSLEFSSVQPNLDELLGDYDILFFASRTNGQTRYSRRTKGKLLLEQPSGTVYGKVTMDGSVHHCVVPKPGCFTFRNTGYYDDERRSQCLKVLEFPDDFVPGFQTWSPGYLKVVATPGAVPRWPDNFRRNPPRWDIPFDSIPEARQLQREYFHSSQHSWIHNHLNLPESVGSLIAEFVAPPPLFFFEPGDLWIHMCWDENNLYADDDGLETVLLARRV